MANDERSMITARDKGRLDSDLAAIGFELRQIPPCGEGELRETKFQARHEKVIVSWWPWSDRRTVFTDFREPGMKKYNTSLGFCHNAKSFLGRCKAALATIERHKSDNEK